MNTVRRLIYACLLFVFLILPVSMSATRVSAATDPLGQGCQAIDTNNVSSICKDNRQQALNNPNPIWGPGGVLTTAISILSLIAGVIAVIVIIIAGAKLITSSGSSDTVASARQTIIFAVVSLVVVAAAQLIVHFVLSKL